MSYQAVLWNRQKRIYDLTLAAFVLAALGLFAAVTLATSPSATAETVILRSTAFTALLTLHVILCIGPLARLDRRFNPFLYNRRHLGVAMFCIALVHGLFAIIQYHAGGDTNPLTSAISAYGRDYSLWRAGGGLEHVPFEPFGMVALLILFLMAATSHDFWLRNLGAPVWKLLHMGVYLAYGLVLAHVALGFMQSERHVIYPLLMAAGFAAVAGLHLVAGAREFRAVRAREGTAADGYLPGCTVAELREGLAHTCDVAGTRVAVWLHEGRVFATSNVCRHQGGPLGEGRIIDGCVTCPWHGWNYRVGTGVSPPPYDEVIPTYDVRVIDGVVHINPTPNAPRSDCPGAQMETNCQSSSHGGSAPNTPAREARSP